MQHTYVLFIKQIIFTNFGLKCFCALNYLNTQINKNPLFMFYLIVQIQIQILFNIFENPKHTYV